MVNLKNLKYISLLFYYCPDKCVSLVLYMVGLFVLLYITRSRGITSTIAIAIGPRHVLKGIDKGAKNKIVAQKK